MLLNVESDGGSGGVRKNNIHILSIIGRQHTGQWVWSMCDKYNMLVVAISMALLYVPWEPYTDSVSVCYPFFWRFFFVFSFILLTVYLLLFAMLVFKQTFVILFFRRFLIFSILFCGYFVEARHKVWQTKIIFTSCFKKK